MSNSAKPYNMTLNYPAALASNLAEMKTEDVMNRLIPIHKVKGVLENEVGTMPIAQLSLLEVWYEKYYGVESGNEDRTSSRLLDTKMGQ